MLENPGLIVAGIETLTAQVEDGGSAEEITRAERELQRVQVEEDRAIRLYVSGKITEKQLDHQRRLITERLETLRKALDDYRARESAQAEKRLLGEHIVEWARRAGDRLDGLSDEERKEVLQLLLDGATIDRDNKVKLTLAIPIEDAVSIAGLEPSFPAHFHALATRRPNDGAKTRAAQSLLMRALADGPRPASAIEREAAMQGIAKRTLRRARLACNVICTRVSEPGVRGGPGAWYWSLPTRNTLQQDATPDEPSNL